MMSENNYPIQYIHPVQLSDGTLLQLRPIHPVDRKHALAFRGKLSEQSIYDRFLGYIPKISDKLIQRLTEIDYAEEMAIVAEVIHRKQKEVVAIGRIASEENGAADFAIIIADRWQGKRLGTILTQHLVQVAKDMGFKKMVATIFDHNVAMLEILRRQGFTLEKEEGGTVRAEKKMMNDE